MRRIRAFANINPAWLPGQRFPCDWSLTRAGGVTLDHIRGARGKVGCFPGETLQSSPLVLPGATRSLTRPDECQTRLIVDMATAMTASDMKD